MRPLVLLNRSRMIGVDCVDANGEGRMRCPNCQIEARNVGRVRCTNQRPQCLAWLKTVSDHPANPIGSKRFGMDNPLAVLQRLAERVSIRATMRVM